MSDEPDAELIELASRLRAVLSGLNRRLNSSAAGEGLTPSQASVLQVLSFRGKPVKLSELAAIEGLNPTMLSRIVRKLDDGAMLRRIQDPDDLRAASVEITEDGQRMAELIRDARALVVARALADLPPGTAQTLSDALPALDKLRTSLLPPRNH